VSKQLTYNEADSAGRLGTDLLHLDGKIFRHETTGNLYRVIGIQWDAVQDLWAIVYVPAGQESGIEISRVWPHFLGLKHGEPRFVAWPEAA